MSAFLFRYLRRCRLPRATGLLLLAAGLIGAAPASAATASELLEKAIYAEETVGNLDEAIGLYQQVIDEGKAARAAAAQAQYRLGLCYEKQGKAGEATAAFQAVVDDFPQEKELVAEAQKHLPGALELLPFPWADGDEVQLNMKLATGIDIGTMIYTVAAAKHDDESLWVCRARSLVLNGTSGASTVLCEKESFAPISSVWKHDLLGEASAAYKPGVVEITAAGKDKPAVLKPEPGPVWDNEQAFALFRLLPLKEGYKTTLSIVSSLGGGIVKIGVEVTAKETIDTPAGKFDCYKLELNIGQTFWITADEHRRIARFVGGGVTADAAHFGNPATEPQTLQAEQFTVTLPAGWHSYTPVRPEEDNASTHLLDPEGKCDAEISIGPKDKLSQEEQASPQAWTESYVAGAKKRLKDFKVIESPKEGVQNLGRSVAILEAQYTEGKEPTTILGAAVFSETAAANLRFKVPTDAVEEFRPAFVEIVNSFQLK